MTTLALGALMAILAAPQEGGHGGGKPGHGEGHGHGGHAGHEGRDAHGNPEDLDRYIARMEEPERAAWQKPEEVVAALGLRPGDAACDVGAGPGYFTLRLARAVGPGGKVFAVDVAPEMIAALRERVARAGVGNVTPILARGDDALLPPGACDVVLIVDTFHHFPDGAAYLRSLRPRLKPGGRIVNVDFHKRELPVGPPLDHLVSREEFLAAALAAGLEVVEEADFLPYQYFLVLRPSGA
jgi:SAM-dependent methyltransferase